MCFNIGLWYARIGHFSASSKQHYLSKRKFSPQFFFSLASFMKHLQNITSQYFNSKYLFHFDIRVFINLILLCGNIEKNLRPSQLKITLYVTVM